MSFLSIHHVSKQFGATPALRDFSLDIQNGETIALLGASGCGKTTLLRCLAGFEIPDSGSIRLGETTLVGEGHFIRPHQRPVSLLFQDYALFPHLTAGQNIRLGRSIKDEIQTAEQLLDMVRLHGLADRYPHQLSGGQQQRVALARALATQPQILLLDEPFSNLDRLLRTEIRSQTSSLLRQLGLTTIMVTHDADDAIALADRIAVMDQGQLVGLGTTLSLYENPTTLLVAVLFGEINILRKTASKCEAIRPEHLRLTIQNQPQTANATVRACMSANGRFRITLTRPDQDWTAYSDTSIEPGTPVSVEIPLEKVMELAV